jgi:HSP20 family molecular chaperone IbpA
MTIADKAAEITAALGDDGDEFGPEDVIEEALERRLRRRVLAELADEDEEPGERLMRHGLRRRMLAELFDEDEEPGERLVRRGLRRHLPAELTDEDWEPGERLMRRAIRRHLLAELSDGGPIERRLRRRAARSAAFKPKADIFEHDDTLVIQAELPGVKKGDVEITVDEGDLVISGERKAEPAIKDEDYYQGETRHGRFYRRLPLPAKAKLEQIKADHKDGLLEIRVPMPERPKVALA